MSLFLVETILSISGLDMSQMPLGMDCSCRSPISWFPSNQSCTWLRVDLPLPTMIFQEGKISQTASCDKIHCHLILDGIPACDLETVGRKLNPFFSCICLHPVPLLASSGSVTHSCIFEQVPAATENYIVACWGSRLPSVKCLKFLGRKII